MMYDIDITIVRHTILNFCDCFYFWVVPSKQSKILFNLITQPSLFQYLASSHQLDIFHKPLIHSNL